VALGGFDPRQVYDDAAQDYEDASKDFWQYVALRSVERLNLQRGERVLDVPCGTGPALVAAAEAVGTGGHVVGIDAAPRMVALAQGRVAARAMANVDVRDGDMLALDAPAVPFDALTCALGVFFVDDMAALVRSLAQLVRPATGRLVVSVFGEEFVEPMQSVFVEIVRDIAPHVDVVQPWRRTEREDTLRGLFAGAAAVIDELDVVTDHDAVPLLDPSDWWRVVMGSGLRRTVEELDARAAADVRARCEEYIAANRVAVLRTISRYAVARRGDAASAR
jgi:ubiquinone/menaquinone biosynthesis C-methylase UbiE